MSGTWVSVGTLRLKAVSALSPLAADVVVTGHDREGPPAQRGTRALRGVEAKPPVRSVLEPALAVLLVRPVAAVALVGQDGPDVAVEIQRLRAGQRDADERQESRREGKRGRPHGMPLLG